jgi:hypothetical protein
MSKDFFYNFETDKLKEPIIDFKLSAFYIMQIHYETFPDQFPPPLTFKAKQKSVGALYFFFQCNPIYNSTNSNCTRHVKSFGD